LLTFFGVVAATGIGLLAWRGDRLRAPGRIDSVVSRESAFLANNLLFAALAFVVLLGTVFPLVAEALRGSRLSVGEPYFDRMTTPIGLALLFLMAVAPALPWRAASGAVLRERLLVPAWVGALTMVVAVAFGARGLAEVLAYGLGAFATAGIVRQFVLAMRGRRRALGEPRTVALGRATRSNPRLYGGLVVHFGVVLVAVVLAVSSSYGANTEVRLRRGESATVDGYTLTYLGSRTTRTEQKTSVAADVRIARGDSDLGVYAPSISTFPNSTEGIGTPSVRTGFVEDLYLTLISSPNDGGRITLGVRVNPMIVWLWIGGGVIALGTILALAPRLRRRPRAPVAAPTAPHPADELEEVPA
jgi:cytochrome c-type biogenesis protein CcmF